MIIVKLMGGLGNQLFQYAFGRAFSLDEKKSFYLDTSWYKGRINRKYMLDHFNIRASKISWWFGYFPFNKRLEDMTGEWHSEKWFKQYANIIREDFTLRDPLSPKAEKFLQQIKSTNSVSIHLRGTDYVHGNKSAFHGTATPIFYDQAVQFIIKNVTAPHFFIFTDDIPWAKAHITFPEPHTFVSEAQCPPHEELALMSACKHNIIANSTFSWWAAWLNKNESKIVVAPSRWFADEKANASDILPTSWIKI